MLGLVLGLWAESADQKARAEATSKELLRQGALLESTNRSLEAIKQSQSVFDKLEISVYLRLPPDGTAELADFRRDLDRRAAALKSFLSDRGYDDRFEKEGVILQSQTDDGMRVRVLDEASPKFGSVPGTLGAILSPNIYVFGGAVDVATLDLGWAGAGRAAADLFVPAHPGSEAPSEIAFWIYGTENRTIWRTIRRVTTQTSWECRIGANSLYFLRNSRLVLTITSSKYSDPVLARLLNTTAVDGVEIYADGQVFSLPAALFHSERSKDGQHVFWADLANAGGVSRQYPMSRPPMASPTR